MKPPANCEELLARADTLAGHTLGEIAAECRVSVPDKLLHAKGWVGELLETILGATAGSRPVPDFEELGIELKTVPLNAAHRPQESTFVCVAPLSETINLRWENSTVMKKLAHVLWVPVEAASNIPIAERRIGQPILWRPSADDLAILRADWEEHIEKIALGELADIDARFGTYLQIRPKALNRDDRTTTTEPSGAPSKTTNRGFYLRTHFTRKILKLN